MMRIFLTYRAALLSVVFAATAVASERPNIVLILADDIGYDSVSVNILEMGPLKTPHIDRLATSARPRGIIRLRLTELQKSRS